MQDIYRIEKQKTIPINRKEIYFPKNDGNIIFNEEITLLGDDLDGIYDNNRLRLIIHKDKDLVHIFIASYEQDSGLGYWSFSLSLEEYAKFTNMNDLIKQIFIEGIYVDRGVSMATGIKEKEATDLLKKQDEYGLDI